jgi:hypothetical protein
VPVAHTCNLRYSGGRCQENYGLKPPQAISSRDPISKIPITRKDWWSGSRCITWVQTTVSRKKNPKLNQISFLETRRWRKEAKDAVDCHCRGSEFPNHRKLKPRDAGEGRQSYKTRKLFKPPLTTSSEPLVDTYSHYFGDTVYPTLPSCRSPEMD